VLKDYWLESHPGKVIPLSRNGSINVNLVQKILPVDGGNAADDLDLRVIHCNQKSATFSSA
jgi:hypothetical protein